jgi:hypothetical protein
MDNLDKPITLKLMQESFDILDQKISKPLTLIMGGGGAMIMAHKFPLATSDIDAIPKGMEIHELDIYVKQISMEYGLPGDWMNPYFSTFAHTLPEDFQTRLVQVFHGKYLTVQALGKEEMLIMKCFAHRGKDIAHAKQLLRLGVDLKIVEKQMDLLKLKKIPGVSQALDFLDDLLEQMS